MKHAGHIPMVLPHEVSAHVVELGAGVTGFTPAQLVALSPSRPCGHCSYCREGLANHCLNMRFHRSAMPLPHVQGALRVDLIADATQFADATGLIDVTPLITPTLPLTQAEAAFTLASDRGQAMKVQIRFAED